MAKTFDIDLSATTLDTSAVSRYLFNMDPQRLRVAMDRNERDEVIDAANHTDFFEVRLRLYIAGFRKTLHDTLDEVRQFRRGCPAVAASMIRLVVIQIRKDFLANEWYELIPRLEKANAKIEKLLKQPVVLH